MALKNFLNEENLHRCVKLRGIPYQASQQDVKDFFADFGVDDDSIVIEMRQGKKTGFALVFLKDEEEVQRARQELNKQYIGTRFIDVMIPRLEEWFNAPSFFAFSFVALASFSLLIRLVPERTIAIHIAFVFSFHFTFTFLLSIHLGPILQQIR